MCYDGSGPSSSDYPNLTDTERKRQTHREKNVRMTLYLTMLKNVICVELGVKSWPTKRDFDAITASKGALFYHEPHIMSKLCHSIIHWFTVKLPQCENQTAETSGLMHINWVIVWKFSSTAFNLS